MLLFILNIFLYTVKLLVFSWFTTDQIFFKFICLIVLIIFCYVLKKYPKPIINDIKIIEEHYKIKNKFDLYFCILLLSIYVLMFFIGIFVLRYFNSSRTVNLCSVYEQIYFNIINHIYIVNVINISLIIVILIFYITILKKIVIFFKHYWVKIHIYYSILESNWYTHYIRDIFVYNYNCISLARMLEDNLIFLQNIKFLNKSFFYHLTIFIKNAHYILVIMVLLYDIYTNNWVLQKLFNILPYIFVYDIYIRLCNLYFHIDILNSADYILHDYIYAEDSDIIIISEKEIWINGEPYATATIANCIFFYLKYDLDAHILYQITDQNYYENMLHFSYYKDRKHFKNAI